MAIDRLDKNDFVGFFSSRLVNEFQCLDCTNRQISSSSKRYNIPNGNISSIDLRTDSVSLRSSSVAGEQRRHDLSVNRLQERARFLPLRRRQRAAGRGRPRTRGARRGAPVARCVLRRRPQVHRGHRLSVKCDGLHILIAQNSALVQPKSHLLEYYLGVLKSEKIPKQTDPVGRGGGRLEERQPRDGRLAGPTQRRARSLVVLRFP